MRFWEIDFVKGLAVIVMIFYHLLVDLELYFYWPIGVFEYPVVIAAKIVGFIFTFTLGVNLCLQFDKNQSFFPLFKRGIILLFWAAIISFTTYLIFPSQFIYFGILHLLGLSIFLLIPLVRINSSILNIFLGLSIIISSFFIHLPVVPTMDFYPPIPWFGFSLLGLAFAKHYFPWRQKVTLVPRFKLIQKLGKHSLIIYLTHQPILLTLLYLISKISP